MTKTLLGLLPFGAVVLASAPALGAEAEEKIEAAPNGAETKEHEAAGHEEEHDGIFLADFVLGFGKGPLTVQNPSSTAEPQPRSHLGAGQITTESLVLGGAYEFLPHTSFGGRIPLSFASLHPAGGADRSTASVGNVELVGEYERHVATSVAFLFEMGVSLPTASGQTLPEDLERLPPGSVQTSSYDKAAINRAASFARGGEDTALFAVDRLGVNPKIGAIYTHGKLRLDGTVKMENLFATSTSLTEKYLGELVPKARVAYRVEQHIEPALAAYAPIAFAGAEPGEDKVGFVVEPQVVGYVGALRPIVGVVIPLAGPAADPTTVGVRLALAAVF